MTAPHMSLTGDPAWWQAFAGVAQVLLAVALFWVTRKYVNLTADMVKLQADIVALQKQGEQRELYERRVKVYDCVMGFLAAFARDVKVDLQPILQMYRDTREADFLFGPEIPEFIEKVGKSAHEHRSLRPDSVYQSGDQAKIDRINQLENWLLETAFAEAKQKFGRYLRLTEPDATAEVVR